VQSHVGLCGSICPPPFAPPPGPTLTRRTQERI